MTQQRQVSSFQSQSQTTFKQTSNLQTLPRGSVYCISKCSTAKANLCKTSSWITPGVKKSKQSGKFFAKYSKPLPICTSEASFTGTLNRTTFSLIKTTTLDSAILDWQSDTERQSTVW